MLNQKEKDHVKEFLEYLTEEDLKSLAAINTNNTLKINSREDAIKAILLHESSCTSLLNRKKITKALLFKYLHAKEVAFDGSLDKTSLCRLVLDYWEKSSLTLENTTQQLSIKSGSTPEGQPFNFENELANQFSKWFYSNLNEDFTKSGGEVLQENDFWSDCQGSIYISETNECSSQSFNSLNASETVSLLRGFSSQYDIYFSPNLTPNGVLAKCDPHGLVVVTAHGTLHTRASECVGVFKQIFGLIADPMSQNNYKIKKVSLYLQSSPKPQNLALMNE